MSCNLLKFLSCGAEQIHAKNELQNQHTNRVDISMTAALKDCIGNADQTVSALLSLLNRQVFHLGPKLVPSERINFRKVDIASIPESGFFAGHLLTIRVT